MPGSGTFKLFIKNVDEKTQPSDLRLLFEKYGTVVECDVVKNYGFVHMENEDQGRDAIQNLDGYVVNGQAIKVEAARNRRRINSVDLPHMITRNVMGTIIVLAPQARDRRYVQAQAQKNESARKLYSLLPKLSETRDIKRERK